VWRLRLRGIRVRVTVMEDAWAVDRRLNGGRASRGPLMAQAFAKAPARRGGWHGITLPLAGVTPGIVAHEAVHVAIDAGRQAGLPDDEPLAYAVQAITDALWRRLQALERREAARCA